MTYTNTMATNDAPLGQEQQTEATLATVMTDIATNNFAPGPHRRRLSKFR